MALPVLRCSYRTPVSFSLTRLFLSDSIILNRSTKRRLPSSSPAAVAASIRPYSSDRGGLNENQKVVVVGIPNPFIWFRTRIYYFLIRAYFDKEFNIEEFTEGAKQVCENRFNVIYLLGFRLHYAPLWLQWREWTLEHTVFHVIKTLNRSQSVIRNMY